MKPRELFVVLLRVLAIWEFIYAGATLVPFVRMSWQLLGTSTQLPPQFTWTIGVPGGVHLVASFVLLCFATPLSRFFYPREDDLPVGERTASITFAERIAQIPAAHRLCFWICSAGLLTLLYFGLIARSKVWFNLGTLHTLFLIALGCSAAAYLLRKTLPPLEGFLAAWSVAFALCTVVFALRLVP